MKLKPLKQFTCDTCNDVIHRPDEGMLEWLWDHNTKKYRAFRICHHKTSSPLNGDFGCYIHSKHIGSQTAHLDYILQNPIQHLLSFVDTGGQLTGEIAGCQVQSMREWSELSRRLTIPYYEQARTFFNAAGRDGKLDGLNEISLYLPDLLEELVNEYHDKS